MKRSILGFPSLVVIAGFAFVASIAIADDGDDAGGRNWPQWGQNPQHQGFIDVVGQSLGGQLGDVIFDPFVPQEQAFTGGSLLTHYQAPLTDAQDVFMSGKTGSYPLTADDPTQFQIFHQRRHHWEGGDLVQKWDFQTDWKPLPIDYVGGWEPVYHAVLANGFIYDPGFAGTIFKLNRGAGSVVAQINPFGTVDPNTYTASPLSADDNGNIYYNVIKIDPTNIDPFTGVATSVGSWLVKVTPDDTTSIVSYATLIPDAPNAGDVSNPSTWACVGRFPNSLLPWPPGPVGPDPLLPADPNRFPTARLACGIVRAGVNVAPAIAPDGTVYTVGRVDNSARYGWVIAVNPDLTLKWHMSMRNLFNDGCGVTIPISGLAADGIHTLVEKGKCRNGATFGVDPTTNRRGDGNVIDQSSSSPTVTPDGNVLYGSYTRYNIARGHLIKFNGGTGAVMATFDFGWDSTPAIWRHGGTYSIVIKDNHYDEEGGFYCNPSGGRSNIVCASTGIPAGPFYITQLNANLVPEWKFHSIETNSCMRDSSGAITCTSDHPNGFEWCINAPAIDQNGTVYVNSEDGNLYKIPQGHSGVFDMTSPDVSRIFLTLALGAAYTPLSLDQEGRIYTENDGHLFVIGNDGGPVTHVSRAGTDPDSIQRIPMDWTDGP
jgi:hypothetical protein